jgi:hypothetical protein
MNCIRCAIWLPERSVFCNGCGHKQSVPVKETRRIFPKHNSNNDKQSVPVKETRRIFPKRNSNEDKITIPCVFFAKGQCTKGDKCPYLHSLPIQSAQPNFESFTTDLQQKKTELVVAKVRDYEDPLGHEVIFCNKCHSKRSRGRNYICPEMGYFPNIVFSKNDNDVYYVEILLQHRLVDISGKKYTAIHVQQKIKLPGGKKLNLVIPKSRNIDDFYMKNCRNSFKIKLVNVRGNNYYLLSGYTQSGKFNLPKAVVKMTEHVKVQLKSTNLVIKSENDQYDDQSGSCDGDESSCCDRSIDLSNIDNLDKTKASVETYEV